MASRDPKPERRIRDTEMMVRFHLEMRGEPCERCGLRPGTQIHHRVYRSQAGHDARENFEWLCAACHDAEHS